MNPLPKNPENAPLIGQIVRSDGSGYAGAAAFLSRPRNPAASVPAAREAAPEANNRSPTSEDVAVGRRIKERRRAAGLTQKEVAEAIGVTGAQFHRYESGSTRVATSRLMAIAARLQVRPESLMGMAGQAGPEAAAPAISQPSLSAAGTNDLLELVELFASISNPRRRSAVMAFAKAIAMDEQGAMAA